MLRKAALSILLRKLILCWYMLIYENGKVSQPKVSRVIIYVNVKLYQEGHIGHMLSHLQHLKIIYLTHPAIAQFQILRNIETKLEIYVIFQFIVRHLLHCYFCDLFWTFGFAFLDLVLTFVVDVRLPGAALSVVKMSMSCGKNGLNVVCKREKFRICPVS